MRTEPKEAVITDPSDTAWVFAISLFMPTLEFVQLISVLSVRSIYLLCSIYGSQKAQVKAAIRTKETSRTSMKRGLFLKTGA